MKKFLKILVAIITVLVIAMFVIGKKYHYEQSIVINAPIEKVWNNANSMKSFNQWNPWLKIDPAMKMEYFGNAGEVGDGYFWDSKNDDAGYGKQTILEISPMKKMKTEMKFIRPYEGEATSNLTFTTEGNATKVTWDMDTEMEYPMNIMKLFMDGHMEKSYSEGLNSLKKLSEN
ncbi:Polyketide cyclase / dehydrase and lipid transport [Halpernia humi]|uniref:Polyketide cyclase / dehydrase and lipid transport n=1 Tax=Halpernia humi TaxID=493375 RepID=A0A1H5Z5F9_9FLAO|nr:SRPBCC family protein [Halpernia humi]SEG31759.1 Polyketide cyclase / dehydrase and lipid transport [Halpernia humi]